MKFDDKVSSLLHESNAKIAKSALRRLKQEITQRAKRYPAGYPTGRKLWEIQLRVGDGGLDEMDWRNYTPKPGDEGYIVYYDDDGRGEDIVFKITDDYQVINTDYENQVVEPLIAAPRGSKIKQNKLKQAKIDENKALIMSILKMFGKEKTPLKYVNNIARPKSTSGWAYQDGSGMMLKIGVDADPFWIAYVTLHELAHIIAKTGEQDRFSHDKEFYLTLYKLFFKYKGYLPKEWVQRELNYKPRWAGIALKDVTMTKDVSEALEGLKSL